MGDKGTEVKKVLGLTEAPDEVRLIALEALTPAPWNPNLLPEVIKISLQDDMKKAGQYGIDPILVRFKDSKTLQIVDGHHRVEIAHRLKWKSIRGIVINVSEDDAMALNYKKNSERGNLDPVKEGVLFRLLQKKGMKGKEIAIKFNVDESTVSRRMFLTELTKNVLNSLARGKITTSHIEAVMGIKDAAERTKLLERAASGQWPVKSLEAEVQSRKRGLEEKERWDAAKTGFKVDKCPLCARLPARFAMMTKDQVVDGQNHVWNPTTGEMISPRSLREGEEAEGAAGDEAEAVPGPERDFEVQQSIPEIARALREHFKGAKVINRINADNYDVFITDEINGYVEVDNRKISFYLEARAFESGAQTRLEFDDYEFESKDQERFFSWIQEILKKK